MDRHDRPSPGRYDESSSALPTEYLATEPPSRSGSRRRTLVISAAAAVLAAAVTAGGVITLTGNSTGTTSAGAVTQESSGQGAGSGDTATDQGVTSGDPGDASAQDSGAGSSDSSGTNASGGSTGSSGRSGDTAGGPDSAVGPTADPVANTESTKHKKPAGTDTTQGQGPAPDGTAGYVEPFPQQPGRFNGLGGAFLNLGPLAQPSTTPTPVPSATPTAKHSPKPSAKRTAKPSPKPTAKPRKSPAKSTRAPSSSGKASTVVAAEDEVARLTNIARREQGCGPLRIDERLRKAARGHSGDMAAKGYFDHTSADGRSPWDRIKATGYNSSMLAENIARGQATPDAVVKGWLNSPGHRANIMNCKLKAIGVGVHFGTGGPWWTQDFGSD
jgi:uncharacterized protein YkwD